MTIIKQEFYKKDNFKPKKRRMKFSKPKRRLNNAFLISLFLHLLFILLLVLYKDDKPIVTTFEIKLSPVKNRIKKEEKEAIQKEIKKVIKEKKARQLKTKSNRNQKSQSKASKQTKSFSEMADQDYENIIQSNRSLKYKVKKGESASSNTKWSERSNDINNQNKSNPNQSKIEGIPEGKTNKGRIKWQGRYSRYPIYFPTPNYPVYYRKQGIQGKVILEIEVNPAGKVIRVSVISSSGHMKLDLEAKKAVRRAKFSRSGTNSQNDIGTVSIYFTLKR